MVASKEGIVAQDSIFDIGAAGVDTAKIVADIRATVADKMARGVYTDPRVARAERMNLLNLRNEENFLSFYLECLRDSVFVDINDFEIVERRRSFGSLLVAFKRGIWGLLKFYTYRLWSQQNQVNGLLLAAIEGVESKYRDRIKELEDKVSKLSAGK
jgi:hypothetical protein